MDCFVATAPRNVKLGHYPPSFSVSSRVASVLSVSSGFSGSIRAYSRYLREKP